MKSQIEFINKGKYPPEAFKKRRTGTRLIHILSPILLIALALIIAGCPNASTPAPDQTTPTATTQIPKSSKTMKFGGSSMEPTLHDGDKVKAFSIYRELKRGDIVVFASPESPDITMVKRIIGLPDETIEIKDGHVFINGSTIDEPYILEPVTYSLEPTAIPDDSYFILGDNRNHSSDSHNFGVVPAANIQYIVEIE